jgi:hypothetical protein
LALKVAGLNALLAFQLRHQGPQLAFKLNPADARLLSSATPEL